MASNTSYPRRYYATTYTQLSTIPLKEGNVISIGDTDGLYYDISSTHPGSGDSVVRRKASAVRYVSSLQDATPEPEIIYVIASGTIETATGATIPKYNGYILDTVHSTSETPVWLQIFTNSQDFNVKSTVDNSGKLYVTGSSSNTDNIDILHKNSNIYINGTTSKLHANLEGVADNAIIATTATQAISDTNNVNLLNYIKNLTVSSGQSGSSLVITHGNNTVEEIAIGGTSVYPVLDENDNSVVPGWGSPETTITNRLLLTPEGWISESNLALEAHSAGFDVNGEEIVNYYLHDIVYNNLDRGVYTQDGAGTTSDNPIFTLPGLFSVGVDGIVPGPASSGDTSKFLRGDGTWQDVGSGGVPIYSGDAPGLVPQGNGNTGTFLQEDGSWAASDTTGATNNSDKLYIVGAPYQQAGSPTTEQNYNEEVTTPGPLSTSVDLSDSVHLNSLKTRETYSHNLLPGYDSMLNIDGTDSWTISTTGTNYQEYDCTSLLTDNASTNNIIVSSMEVINSADVESVTTIAWVQAADTTGRIVVNKTWAVDQGIDITDIDTFTSYLNDNAFIVWYRSSNYTSTSNQYYVITIRDYTTSGLYANIGTIIPVTYLNTDEYIDFVTNEVIRSDWSRESIATSIDITYLQGYYTFTTPGNELDFSWEEVNPDVAPPTTYTNSSVYIDNNDLYSNGEKVATSSDISDASDSLWPIGSVHITVQAYTGPVPLPGTWTYLGSDSMLGETMNYYKRIS